MKLSFRILFSDGSNPYYSFQKDKNEILKEVKRWYKTHFDDYFEIWTENHTYRISNTAWGTWYVYRTGKWVDEVISNEYAKLGNAIKFLEKLLDNTSQTC